MRRDRRCRTSGCGARARSSGRRPRAAGTPTAPSRLYADGHRPPTADGRARFAPTPHAAPADAARRRLPARAHDGPAGRPVAHDDRGPASPPRCAPRPARRRSTLHPDDARRHRGRRPRARRARAAARCCSTARLDADAARAASRSRRSTSARCTPRPGAGALNAVSHAAVDPTSKQPELKAIAVAARAGGRAPGGAARRAPPRGGSSSSAPGWPGWPSPRRCCGATRRGAITMLGEEPGPVYNRILLSQLLAGECGPGELELRPLAWYAERGVDLRGGCAGRGDRHRRAHRPRRRRRACTPTTRSSLATGSRPFVPPVPGADRRTCSVFRTRARRRRDRRGAGRGARDAVVLGGGLLGLEAAAGLRAHGARVTVVEPAPRLMGRQLDARRRRDARARRSRARGIDALAGAHRRPRMRRRRASCSTTAPSCRPTSSSSPPACARRSTLARGGRAAPSSAASSSTTRCAPARRACLGGRRVRRAPRHRSTGCGRRWPSRRASRARRSPATRRRSSPAVTATTLKVAGVDVYAGGRAEAVDGDDEVVAARHAPRRLPQARARRRPARRRDAARRRRRRAPLHGRAAQRTRRSTRRCSPPAAPGAGRADARPGRRAVCSCNAVTAGDDPTDAIRARGLTHASRRSRTATRASTGCGGCAADVRALLERTVHRARNTSDQGPKPPLATIGAMSPAASRRLPASSSWSAAASPAWRSARRCASATPRSRSRSSAASRACPTTASGCRRSSSPARRPRRCSCARRSGSTTTTSTPLLGRRVAAVRADEHAVDARRRRELPYAAARPRDRLERAAAADPRHRPRPRPRVPRPRGLRRDPRRRRRRARSAAVIGGGLLGLEAARGIAAQGCPVTVVHLMDRLMERQLDAGAAALLQRRARHRRAARAPDRGDHAERAALRRRRRARRRPRRRLDRDRARDDARRARRAPRCGAASSSTTRCARRCPTCWRGRRVRRAPRHRLRPRRADPRAGRAAAATIAGDAAAPTRARSRRRSSRSPGIDLVTVGDAEGDVEAVVADATRASTASSWCATAWRPARSCSATCAAPRRCCRSCAAAEPVEDPLAALAAVGRGRARPSCPTTRRSATATASARATLIARRHRRGRAHRRARSWR